MDAPVLEALVRRSNPALVAERAAVAAGRWEPFQAERVPPPSRIHFARRAAWREALDRALAIGCHSEVQEVLAFPVWFCSNDDDIPGSKWEPAAMVAFDDGTFELHERKHLPGIVLARIEQARLGFLVRSIDFAPSVTLAFRNDFYGALESRRIERVVEIVRAFESTETPLPERDLPPFATDGEGARVLLPPADPAIAARIDAAIAKLRSFPDGAEALVATRPKL